MSNDEKEAKRIKNRDAPKSLGLQKNFRILWTEWTVEETTTSAFFYRGKSSREKRKKPQIS